MPHHESVHELQERQQIKQNKNVFADVKEIRFAIKSLQGGVR
jgi:hypothetical protein